MRLVRRDLIKAFARKHPDSRSALRSWTQVIEANSFKQLAELKETFGSADYVKPYTVFNIAGNKYRLIALVDYGLQTVSVEYLLTHEAYDEQRWKTR